MLCAFRMSGNDNVFLFAYICSGLQAQGRVDYWHGAMMTTYSKHVADWEGEAYGPFVSVPQVR